MRPPAPAPDGGSAEDWSRALDAIELDLHHDAVGEFTDRTLGWVPPPRLGRLPDELRPRAAELLERVREAERAVACQQAEIRRELDDLVRRHSTPKPTADTTPSRFDSFA